MAPARLLIAAGEASGDRLAADLVTALRRRLPGLSVRGVAGPAMRAAGVEAVAHQEQIAVMGVAEVLARLPEIQQVRRAMFAAIAEGADLLVVVDAPDFNLPMARAARRAGVPVVFYVSPQVWAWRKGRAKTIAGLAEEVLCLLPFEPAYYEAHGGRASFVGHPVLDRCPPAAGEGVDWALLPGSRRAEIAALLPDMLAAAGLLLEAEPGAVIRLPVAPGLRREDLEAVGGEALARVALVGSLREAVEPAKAALVASGTATLEVACMGRPMAVAYRVHPLTYAVGRALVKGVEHMALPNLILGRRAIPELLQDFTPQDLVDAWRAAAEDDAQRAALVELRAALGGGPLGGADERAAERVAAVLQRRLSAAP